MLKNRGRSVKWKELAVNRTSLVMIKRRVNTFFMIVQRKVLKAAEVFATTVKRWSQGKSTNQRIALLIWQAAMGIELLTEEQYRELQKLGNFAGDLVARGLSTERRYLFVIDEAKALRAAIERVFGARAEVQRCHLHKRRNVKEYLPKNAQGDYDRRSRNAYAMTGTTRTTI